MSMDLPGGLVEAKKVVQGYAERLDKFDVVISQDDPADNLNEMELDEPCDGRESASSYWFRDESLAVVLVRALTPDGFSLVAVEDRLHYATGRYARTVARPGGSQ